MDQYLITTAKLASHTRHGGGIASIASAFHYEATPAQASLGDICAVVEVLAPYKQASEVTQLIFETIRKDYYESVIADPAERFESSVKAVNRELAIYATHGNSAWIGKVSAVVAVVTGSQVHITQTGSAQAFLYRHGKDTCITTGLASKEPHRPSKTFGNIASGSLAPNDRILLATPALFHQLAHEDLTSIVSDNSAPAAVAKLQQLLSSSEAQERIAATITEVNTAEAAALAPQSGLPKEAHLGRAENLFDSAKNSAAPLAGKVLKLAKRSLSGLASFYRQQLAPGTRRATLALVRWLRKRLATKAGRIGFVGALGLIVVAVIWMMARGGNNQALASLASQYKDAYTKQSAAADQLSNGDKLGAKANYQAALAQLATILKSPKAGSLDNYLAKHPHGENDPVSATKLRSAIAAQIDQIDGLTKLNPGQLADFAALGNAKPTQMEQVGNQFIFVDPASGSSIYRYDLTKAKLQVVANHPAGLGQVVALAASSSGDGVYLLSDQPAVWFYSLSDSSLTQVQAVGGWPKGQAMASYAGNLYILSGSDGALYKLPRIGSGYGAKVPYPVNDASLLKGASAMAVDGNIYIGTSKGFTRVLSGVVQKSDLVFPSNLTSPRSIVSVDQGKLLIVTDSNSNRIGLFSFAGTLQYTRQLQVSGATTVYKASADASDNTLYALVDQKFVKLKY